MTTPAAQQPTLVLASASVYRRALLERLALDVECVAADIDESAHAGEPPESLVRRLALGKASAVAASRPHSIVIGSDQIAVLDNKILGKPLTHEVATRQLAACSGRRVRFLTAVAVLGPGSGTRLTHTDTTTVHFRDLSAGEIERYLRKDVPYDCAGGFKAEAGGIALFRSIDNRDPTALIGLPLIWVCAALAELGVAVV